MSQWEAILKLTDAFQEQVHAVYSQGILPVLVRQYLAYWIESQDWKLAARDWSLATVLCQNLFEHLDIHYSRFTEAREVVQANSIRNFKLKVQSQYQENPQLLAELIRDLLQKEKQILLESQESQSQNGQQVHLPMETGQQSKIEQRVNEAKERVMSLDQEVKFLEEQQEIFDFRYKTYKILSAAHSTDPGLKKKLAELQALLNDLDRKRREIIDQVKQLLGLCETLLGFLQQELSDWLQRQRLLCIGAGTDTCLKQLETWVTKTVEVFFQLKRILCNLSELPGQISYEGDPMKIDPPRLQERLLEMLRCLLERSFVVSKQPIMTFPCKRPLVLKTSTQFSVGGRALKKFLSSTQKVIDRNLSLGNSLLHQTQCLVGLVQLNVMIPFFAIRCFILKKRFLVNLPELRHDMKVSYTIDKYPPDIKGYRRFNLLCTQDKTLEYTQENELAVDHKHLTLKEQRAGGGGKGSKGVNDGSLSVMEELHIITLNTQFSYEGVKLNIELYMGAILSVIDSILFATTLPFVVISNLTQFARAWASVLWFNLLSPDPKDVTFFSKPPAAPWILIADALSWQFSCCTKRGLNAKQLQMLEKKLCGSVLNENSVVTWSTFSKENMPEVSFTFWEWFDAVLNLVKGRLENIWEDGYVMGFVNRNTEEALLRTKQQGTFLLRFSESMRDGGITCSWVDHQPDETYLIQSVRPFTRKELTCIPLTEIIRNYQLLTEENIPENPLKYLYPNILKDDAFGKYYEQRTEVNSEYQRYMSRMLIVVSERNVDDSQSSIASGTPQYFSDTSQNDQEMLLHDPTGYPQNVANLGNFMNQMTMDNVFIDPANDPMLPNQSSITNEVFQECFVDFH